MTALRTTIVRLLCQHRLTLACEKDLQREIAIVFDVAALSYRREVHLGARDIVDFMVDDPADPLKACAIEVKIKGQARPIYRQLERYCGYPAVGQIVLATNVPMNLPAAINCKPTAIANLGRGWL